MMVNPSWVDVVLEYNKICEVVPHAAYVHCYAHCLNLVPVDSTKSVSEAFDFFSLMETLYVFFVTKCYPCYLPAEAI